VFAMPDADELDSLYRRVAPKIAAVLNRSFQKDVVDDAIQQIFTNIVASKELSERLRRMDLTNSLWYLLTATRRAATRIVLRESRFQPLATVATPELELDRSIDLQTALEWLPSKDRNLLLHYYQGFTAEEIAAHLGTTRGAVDVRIHRALKKVREFIWGNVRNTPAKRFIN
jgi:RNA polymerase sigma-70 factor (ECF subfamily)